MHKIDFPKYIFLALVFLPCFTLLEIVLRGSNHIFLFQDLVAPFFFFFIFSMLLISFAQMIVYIVLLFVIAFIIYYVCLLFVYPRLIHTPLRRPVKFILTQINLIVVSSWIVAAFYSIDFDDPYQLFHVIASFTIFYFFLAFGFHAKIKRSFGKPISFVLTAIDIILIKFLLIAACWRPITTAPILLGSFLVCLLYCRYRKRRIEIASLFLLMGGVAVSLFGIQHLLMLSNAELIPAVRLYDQPANDAIITSDGTAMVLSRCQDGLFLYGGGWQSIASTRVPQRLAVDLDDGAVYIANYDSKFRRVVTKFHNYRTSQYDLADCWRAIDVAIYPEKKELLVACEKSNNLFILQQGEENPPTRIPIPIGPYAISIDHRKKRAFVTTQIGLLYIIDIDAEIIVKRMYVGPSWGVEVDELTGNIFIALFAAGDILVLNDALEIIERIPVDYAPRDLAIDQETGNMLVGNYLTGTVNVIDERYLSKKRRLIIGHKDIFNRLRGVEKGMQGIWLVSDLYGVWIIDNLFGNK